MRTFPAKYSSLDDIRTYVEQAAEEAALTDKAVYAVQMAVDEASTNIIDHAYGGETDDEEIEITCQTNKDSLTLILRDKGKPFDIDSVWPNSFGISYRIQTIEIFWLQCGFCIRFCFLDFETNFYYFPWIWEK